MDERHARRRHRPPDPRRRPVDGYRPTPPARFDRLVGDALRGLPAPLLDHLQAVEVQIADVPPPPDPPGPGAASVVLASYQVAAHPQPPLPGGHDRLVLYRRPLEARSRTRLELLSLVREVVVHELAHHLGIDDDGLEELGWG